MAKAQGRVVHCKREHYDVYIGRPSQWGNPFPIGKTCTREQAINAYRKWIRTKPELIAAARKHLRGKVLGCFCAPLACHGEVLLEIANG